MCVGGDGARDQVTVLPKPCELPFLVASKLLTSSSISMVPLLPESISLNKSASSARKQHGIGQGGDEAER